MAETQPRFLEAAQLWLWPNALILLVGRKEEVSSVLWRPAFRNTIRSLYLGLQEKSLQDLQSPFRIPCRLVKGNTNPCGSSEGLQNIGSHLSIKLYSRCLYCDKGNGKIRVLATWDLRSRKPNFSDPFLYQMTTLDGHLIRVSTLPFFLTSISIWTQKTSPNRWYEIRPPLDLAIGNPTKNGSWTGTLGDIYRGIADVSFSLSSSPERLKVSDLLRTIEADTLVIVSLKPQLLPQYLVIIRPFTVDVWIYLTFSIFLCGVALWLLEKTRSDLTGEKSMSLSWSIFYSWAVMLDDAPSTTPRYISGQMLLGWWLVAALVISTVYRSALVAFLSVQSKTEPIDSFQDLVSRGSWRWGVHDFVMSGQVRLFLENSNDTAVKHFYKHAEMPNITYGLTKALKGRYSLLGIKRSLQSAIDLEFSDDLGQTPLYLSRTNYHIVTDFGWSLRRGAPYHRLLLYALTRLVDVGLVNYWMKEVTAARVHEVRRQKKDKNIQNLMRNLVVQELMVNNEVILGNRHLIGVYLVTLVGLAVSFLVLVGEKMVHSFYAEKERKLIGVIN
ncbi:glutamate receptor ionotropic, kainate glr-3-like [Macrobrachium rosenbergii]|uniref:glutamate receptor ionotropic, kainate glr-3-like n=1 Tax=Macrobrachium rosenbergii TaxID=79674 RepID=UPI0034D4002D